MPFITLTTDKNYIYESKILEKIYKLSNLNFAHELISSSYFFNPNEEKSITDVILLALSNKNHPKSSIKIKNSIGLIFNKLNNV